MQRISSTRTTEKFDKNGNVIEKITETFYDYDYRTVWTEPIFDKPYSPSLDEVYNPYSFEITCEYKDI